MASEECNSKLKTNLYADNSGKKQQFFESLLKGVKKKNDNVYAIYINTAVFQSLLYLRIQKKYGVSLHEEEHTANKGVFRREICQIIVVSNARLLHLN